MSASTIYVQLRGGAGHAWYFAQPADAEAFWAALLDQWLTAPVVRLGHEGDALRVPSRAIARVGRGGGERLMARLNGPVTGDMLLEIITALGSPATLEAIQRAAVARWWDIDSNDFRHAMGELFATKRIYLDFTGRVVQNDKSETRDA